MGEWHYDITCTRVPDLLTITWWFHLGLGMQLLDDASWLGNAETNSVLQQYERDSWSSFGCPSQRRKEKTNHHDVHKKLASMKGQITCSVHLG
jgi:hypothetical protein